MGSLLSCGKCWKTDYKVNGGGEETGSVRISAGKKVAAGACRTGIFSGGGSRSFERQ